MPLRLLQSAVQELHVIQGTFRPPFGFQDTYNLLANRGKILGVRRELQDELGAQIHSCVYRSNCQHELKRSRIEADAPVHSLLVDPVDGVVEIRGLSAGTLRLGAQCAALLNNGRDDPAGFVKLPSGLPALWYEPVAYAAQGAGDHTQIRRRDEEIDRVVDSTSYPFTVLISKRRLKLLNILGYLVHTIFRHGKALLQRYDLILSQLSQELLASGVDPPTLFSDDEQCFKLELFAWGTTIPFGSPMFIDIDTAASSDMALVTCAAQPISHTLH